MIKCTDFIDVLKNNSITQFTGIPCSMFSSLWNCLNEQHKILSCYNESQAMANIFGAQLAGENVFLLCQNSALGYLINPINTIFKPYNKSFMGLMSYRGYGDDEPQHFYDGKTTEKLLELLDIHYDFIDSRTTINQISEFVQKALILRERNQSYLMLLVDKVFDEYKFSDESDFELSLEDSIKIITDELEESIKIFSSTGIISRQLKEYSGSRVCFYNPGGLGLLIPLSSTYSKLKKESIAILCGDGEFMFHFSNVLMIENDLVIVFDNGSFNSVNSKLNLNNTQRIDKILIQNCIEVQTKEQLRETIRIFNEKREKVIINLKINNQKKNDLKRLPRDFKISEDI